MPKMSKLPKMPKIKDGNQFYRFQVSGVRCQRTEDRGQKTEGRSQMTDSMNSEVGKGTKTGGIPGNDFDPLGSLQSLVL
jgi:hypothetical protein